MGFINAVGLPKAFFAVSTLVFWRVHSKLSCLFRTTWNKQLSETSRTLVQQNDLLGMKQAASRGYEKAGELIGSMLAGLSRTSLMSVQYVICSNANTNPPANSARLQPKPPTFPRYGYELNQCCGLGLTEYCQTDGTFDSYASEIREATSRRAIAAGQAGGRKRFPYVLEELKIAGAHVVSNVCCAKALL